MVFDVMVLMEGDTYAYTLAILQQLIVCLQGNGREGHCVCLRSSNSGREQSCVGVQSNHRITKLWIEEATRSGYIPRGRAVASQIHGNEKPSLWQRNLLSNRRKLPIRMRPSTQVGSARNFHMTRFPKVEMNINDDARSSMRKCNVLYGIHYATLEGFPNIWQLDYSAGFRSWRCPCTVVNKKLSTTFLARTRCFFIIPKVSS